MRTYARAHTHTHTHAHTHARTPHTTHALTFTHTLHTKTKPKRSKQKTTAVPDYHGVPEPRLGEEVPHSLRWDLIGCASSERACGTCCHRACLRPKEVVFHKVVSVCKPACVPSREATRVLAGVKEGRGGGGREKGEKEWGRRTRLSGRERGRDGVGEEGGGGEKWENTHTYTYTYTHTHTTHARAHGQERPRDRGRETDTDTQTGTDIHTHTHTQRHARTQTDRERHRHTHHALTDRGRWGRTVRHTRERREL